MELVYRAVVDGLSPLSTHCRHYRSSSTPILLRSQRLKNTKTRTVTGTAPSINMMLRRCSQTDGGGQPARSMAHRGSANGTIPISPKTNSAQKSSAYHETQIADPAIDLQHMLVVTAPLALVDVRFPPLADNLLPTVSGHCRNHCPTTGAGDMVDSALSHCWSDRRVGQKQAFGKTLVTANIGNIGGGI